MKPKVGHSCYKDKRFYFAELVLLASCVLCTYTQVGGSTSFNAAEGTIFLFVQAVYA